MVYVDNDPVVSVHAEALMAQNHTTAVTRADLRDVDGVPINAGWVLARDSGQEKELKRLLARLPQLDRPDER